MTADEVTGQAEGPPPFQEPPPSAARRHAPWPIWETLGTTPPHGALDTWPPFWKTLINQSSNITICNGGMAFRILQPLSIKHIFSKD